MSVSALSDESGISTGGVPGSGSRVLDLAPAKSEESAVGGLGELLTVVFLCSLFPASAVIWPDARLLTYNRVAGQSQFASQMGLVRLSLPTKFADQGLICGLIGNYTDGAA